MIGSIHARAGRHDGSGEFGASGRNAAGCPKVRFRQPRNVSFPCRPHQRMREISIGDENLRVQPCRAITPFEGRAARPGVRDVRLGRGVRSGEHQRADARRPQKGVSGDWRTKAATAAIGRRPTSTRSETHAADPKAGGRRSKGMRRSVREVVKRFPDDRMRPLFAQSLMDTSPWNYWNLDGTPHSFTPDVLAALESVLKRNPDHLGAIHLYIHATEASPDPGRAEQYADKLPGLVPGAGHLVHMPAHTYLRIGRYRDASTANERAIKADEAYFAGDAVAGNLMYQVGYYPHNIHFFITSAQLEGRRADALKAGEELGHHMPPEMLRDPGVGGWGSTYCSRSLHKVRFSLWDDVLAEPDPGRTFRICARCGMRRVGSRWHVSAAPRTLRRSAMR